MDVEGMQASEKGDGRLVLKQREATALIEGLWAKAAFTMEDVVKEVVAWKDTTHTLQNGLNPHNMKRWQNFSNSHTYAQTKDGHNW